MTTIDADDQIDPPLLDDDHGIDADDTNAGSTGSEEKSTERRQRRRRRRRPAPKANLFWRFVFPLLVIGAGVAVFAVWKAGTKAVLDTTDGVERETITDPALPGFRAFVDPTPTMLIAHVDDGTLIGVTVVARTALDDGGTMVLLSADMFVDLEANADSGVLLGNVFDADGLDGLQALVGELFGFGFTETLELETDGLRQVIRLVEPIPVRLLDDLVEADDDGNESVFLRAGVRELDGATAAEVYQWSNPGEFDANRLERQQALWVSWLGEIDSADDLIAATLPFEDGLSPYLRSLGAGTADISILPVVPLPFDDALPLYVLNEGGFQWLAQKAQDMVPLPISSSIGARPSVQLLDGTGERTNRDRMIPVLVQAGAQISVIGNAETFDVVDTVVAYHSVDGQAAAEDLALVIGAVVVFDEDPDLPVDLTVIVGTDQEAQ